MRAIFGMLLGLMVWSGAGIYPGFAQTVSIETMAGQMIMVGFRGAGVDSAGVREIRHDMAAGRIGGVMYLGFNVASLGAVKAMNQRFVAASPGLPPLIALDQEGGSIERLTRAVGFTEISSAARIAASMDPDQARQVYSGMARELFELGFNVNFGPVVDLNINPQNPIIGRYGRSYGRDARIVVDYALAFIAAHRNAGVLTTLKHFPGHGSSRGDSHKGFVDITDYWQEEELAPYRALIGTGNADLVMVGHLYHARFAGGAGQQYPASLSPEWIEGVLRQNLGYQGVVISDDLEMGAIRQLYSLRQSVVAAVRAGTDILLFSNTANYRPSLATEILDILLDEARADPDFRARIEQSYQRIAALKARI